jgi:endonuclease/exonuclease/phosphatase family metal-dependent hydrolase
VLVQEAFRADESVPPLSNGWAPRERPRGLPPKEDISDVAEELDLNLAYAPSMRNGFHRSDRGNAILSDLPLDEPSAFELPFVAQRRVPLSATVRVPAGPAPARLRVCSAHLDPWGPPGRDWLGAAGRAVQARQLLHGLEARCPPGSLPLVLGADLNTSRGRREAAYRMLREAGFSSGVPHHDPVWRHTYHGMPRLAIDWLLLRAGGAVAQAAVHRLSENARDRGPTVFGSDHHPLIAFVRFRPSLRRPA